MLLTSVPHFFVIKARHGLKRALRPTVNHADVGERHLRRRLARPRLYWQSNLNEPAAVVKSMADQFGGLGCLHGLPGDDRSCKYMEFFKKKNFLFLRYLDFVYIYTV